VGNEVDLVCPVCRAKQTPREFCRRCRADLRLYVKAIQSHRRATELLEDAARSGREELAARTEAYLRWLRP
jgi:hypothetical protein